MLSALLLATLLQSTPAEQPRPTCVHDRAALLALRPQAFDQDLKGGWRPLADKPECAAIAADLIATYRKLHWHELSSGELHISYWHEGQVRAELGQYQQAIGLLMAGVNPDSSDKSFQEYAVGTVAFLNRDKNGLEAARARLAQIPEPPEFAKQAAEFHRQYGITLHWPTNLDVLDRLIRCFDKPYREAYAGCPATPSKN